MPLSVKDGMGAWISDFKKSDAPQFKGKSEKERREMAIAAYMDAKRGGKNEATDNPPFTPDPKKPQAKNSDGTKTDPMSRARQLAKMARDRNMKNESVELDEAKDMYKSAAGELKDYANKSCGIDKKDFHTAAKHIENIGRANLMNKGQHLAKLSKHLRDLDTSPREKVLSVLNKHGHNVGDFMPGAKMRRESVQLDELSPATHKSYQAKAFKSGAAGMAAKRMGTMSAKDAYDNEKKRHAGIELSKSLQRRDARKKNEKTVSELKKSTLGSYIKKASQDASSKAYRSAMDASSINKDQRKQSGDAFAKSMKRQKGIEKATNRLTKEGKIEEAAQFKVDIEGLPPTFIQGKSSAEILANLRKIVKQPSMIKNVERYTDMEVKKAYRQKAQGRPVDEAKSPNPEDNSPASPDEKSMAIKQAEFIEYVAKEIADHMKKNKEFPEWMQNKLSALHQKAKDMHSTLGAHGTGMEDK